ncbi:hypothetical protein GGI07_004774 [Coemansia sp. Benny D115]|nr:hypothetical protein GGI07_004774 [Coemansia sp. Benny D115]
MFLPREVASMDSLTSHSEPRLATKFSAGARPVEARGQILSQKQSLPTPLRSRPSSSSANSVTGRQKALGILRPLATLDTPPSVVNKGGSSAPSTTGLDAMAAVGMSITPAVDIISHMAAPQPSDSSDGSQQQQRLGANTRGRNRGNTTTSYDSSDNSISLGRTLQRSTLVAKPSTQQTTAEPVVATKDCSTMDSCSETKSTDDVAPQPDTNTTATATAAAHVSLWSKIASLTLRSTPLSSGSEQSAHPNQSPQKPAVQRLREIEARQPAAEQGATHSNSNPDADADANSTPVPVSASVSDSTSADNGLLAATEPEQDNAVSDAAASTKAADNSVQASAVIQEGDAAVVVEEPIVDTAADNHRDAAAAAIVPETAAVESASAQEQQAAAPAQPAHPAEPARPGWLWGWLRSTPESSKDTAGSPITENRSGNSGDNDATNMLLPDLDVGPKPSAIVPTTATTSTVASIASADCASNHSESNEDRPHTPTDITPSGHSGGNADGSNKDDTDATIAGSPRLKDGQPLYKRLRKVGLSMVDAFVDMAPEWARNLVRERAGADVLGQRGSSDDSSGARMTTQQIRAQMDLGAKSLGRIAVIGVHGWFPIRMLQMIAGEPTGKSEKFCLMMRDALKEYLFEQHGVEVNSNDITLFPLVGEGRIEDRVNILLSQIIDSGESSAHAGQIESGTQSRSESRAAAEANGKQKPGSTAKSSNNKNKQLIPGVSVLEAKDAAGTLPSGSVSSSSGNSTNPAGKQSVMIAESLMPERSRRAQVLAEADTVFVVTHSQGTPVSAMLLERLIELGIVDTDRQRVGMLAMAGISHGPLPYLKDNLVIRYIESEAARELFELMDPSSYQSQRYVYD